MVYNTENGEEPHFRNHQINHKYQEADSGYYCWKLRKRKENTKQISETTRVDQPEEPSVQSELAELEQQRICL